MCAQKDTDKCLDNHPKTSGTVAGLVVVLVPAALKPGTHMTKEKMGGCIQSTWSDNFNRASITLIKASLLLSISQTGYKVL